MDFLTENKRNLNDIRERADWLSKYEGNKTNPAHNLIYEPTRALHENEKTQILEKFAKLSDLERTKLTEFMEERRSLLQKIQPTNPADADEDQKDSMRKLEAVKYLGKLLDLKSFTQ